MITIEDENKQSVQVWSPVSTDLQYIHFPPTDLATAKSSLEYDLSINNEFKIKFTTASSQKIFSLVT